MAKSKKPLSYQEERDIWYQKLSDSDFEDIEEDEYNLKFYTAAWFKAQFKKHGHSWQTKASYYQMASSFLEEYKFANSIEQTIWMYHSEGISYRDIAKLLNKLKESTAWNKVNVNHVVKKLKIKMFDLYMSASKNYHE